MQSTPQPIVEVRSASKTWLVVALVLGGLFTIGIIVLSVSLLRPKGEKVGSVDLMRPGASMAVETTAGDTLHFRLDVTMTVPISLDSERAERAARDALGKSTLTVFVTRSGAPQASATCRCYTGKVMVSSHVGRALTLGGVIVDCTIKPAYAGRYDIGGSISWAPGINATAAALEVRIDRGDRQ